VKEEAVIEEEIVEEVRPPSMVGPVKSQKRFKSRRASTASAPGALQNGDRSHICATQRFYTEEEEKNLRVICHVLFMNKQLTF
jgi:hypothetical protein